MRGGAVNYLDLFSGIGGFHLGLKMAGFKFDKVFYSEIDDYANKVYAKNFPDAVPLGDITKINPAYLVSKIDIITGGFPCQDISVAGKQKGITGERSSLFHEIIRLCSVLRPRIMFLENVPNLITGESGLWFKTVMESIASIGYSCEWQIISAADVGAPHLRKRVWIVAYPDRGLQEQQKKEIRTGRNTVDGCCKDVAYPESVDAGRSGLKLHKDINREYAETDKVKGRYVSESGRSSENVAHSKCNGEKRKESENGQGRGAVLGSKGRGKEDVAHTSSDGCCKRTSCGGEIPEKIGRTESDNRDKTPGEDVSNTCRKGLQRTELCRNHEEKTCRGKKSATRTTTKRCSNGGERRTTQRGLGGMVDGLSDWIHEPEGIPRVIKGQKDRVNRLKCLGNAVVPQVVQLIGEMILKSGLI